MVVNAFSRYYRGGGNIDTLPSPPTPRSPGGSTLRLRERVATCIDPSPPSDGPDYDHPTWAAPGRSWGATFTPNTARGWATLPWVAIQSRRQLQDRPGDRSWSIHFSANEAAVRYGTLEDAGTTESLNQAVRQEIASLFTPATTSTPTASVKATPPTSPGSKPPAEARARSRYSKALRPIVSIAQSCPSFTEQDARTIVLSARACCVVNARR